MSLYLLRLYCGDIIINAPPTNNNKGAHRRNCVFHSRHVDVFNSNGQAYENAWDFTPAAETVVAGAGVLRYLNS